MMGFKEWINTEYGGHTFAFFRKDDTRGRANAYYLIEGGRAWDIDNNWSVRMDQPHAPNMQKHNHIMFKGDEVSVINRDGTQSHNTTLDGVPKWLVQKIKGKGWITESLLVEASGDPITIPRGLIDATYRRARLHDLIAPIWSRISPPSRGS